MPASALSPEEARAEYDRRLDNPQKSRNVSDDKVREIIDALDDRGAWLEEVRIKNYENRVRVPFKYFEGFTTRTYIQNMGILLEYLKTAD